MDNAVSGAVTGKTLLWCLQETIKLCACAKTAQRYLQESLACAPSMIGKISALPDPVLQFHRCYCRGNRGAKLIVIPTFVLISHSAVYVRTNRNDSMQANSRFSCRISLSRMHTTTHGIQIRSTSGKPLEKRWVEHSGITCTTLYTVDDDVNIIPKILLKNKLTHFYP